jgi:putative transposase
MLPIPRFGIQHRTTNVRAVLNAIFYLLRPGCQWRLLLREFPVWGTVYHYLRSWDNAGVWTYVQRTLYEMTRIQAGRNACPSVVIMDSQSVKTTERGGVRGFDAHKRVKGRKRHILVDTSGLLIASRVALADISDRTSAIQLLGGLDPLFPHLRTIIADAGPREPKAFASSQATGRLEATDRQATPTGILDHRPNLDRGAQSCLARAQ